MANRQEGRGRRTPRARALQGYLASFSASFRWPASLSPGTASPPVPRWMRRRRAASAPHTQPESLGDSVAALSWTTVPALLRCGAARPRCFTGFLARLGLGRLVRRPRSTTPTQDTGACHRIIPDETELTSRSGSRKQAKCLIIADEQGRGKKNILVGCSVFD